MAACRSSTAISADISDSCYVVRGLAGAAVALARLRSWSCSARDKSAVRHRRDRTGWERSDPRQSDLGARRGACGRMRDAPVSPSDPVLAYVLAARPLHAALREAVIQLAAFALYRATRTRALALDITPLDRARDTLGDHTAGLAALRAPDPAAHHHHHLMGAATALERALAAGYATGTGADTLFFAAVEEAERHIRAAGRLLPGFEMVDLTQACCAMHAPAALVTHRVD